MSIIKKILIVISIAAIVLIVVCSIYKFSTQEIYKGNSMSASTAGSPMKFKSEMKKTEQIMDTEQNVSTKPTRLTIKTGTINVVVKNIADSVKNIIQYTESKGGWVVSSEVIEQEETHSGNIIVRIPAKTLNEAMTYFKRLVEKVSYEEIQGQDMTEEYTDLQSNLKNLEATEGQLYKIMERTGTIPDVLAVQKELTIVRGQIEQIKGQMQYLKENVKMATITINLAISEEALPISSSEKWRPKYVVKQAWSSFLGFIKGLSYLLIWIAIYAIIIVPVVFVVLICKRELKKRKAIREKSKL